MKARAEQALDHAAPAETRRPPRDWNGTRLTPREHETLQLLLTGAPQKQIAAHMGLSMHTAHDYVKALYRKLRVNSRVELMAMVLGRP